MLRAAKIVRSSFNPEPTATAYLRDAVAVGSGLNEPTQPRAVYIDLEDKHKWTKIGETTAWNWQQGCRLQWRPRSQEILWNDRADDGSHFVCRAYDFRTGARRTLPRPIYDVSRDGTVALTHDFQRMKHGGTEYVGIPDRYADERAPAESGIEKMNLDSGQVQFLVSLKRMAEIAFPQGYAGKTNPDSRSPAEKRDAVHYRVIVGG